MCGWNASYQVLCVVEEASASSQNSRYPRPPVMNRVRRYIIWANPALLLQTAFTLTGLIFCLTSCRLKYYLQGSPHFVLASPPHPTAQRLGILHTDDPRPDHMAASVQNDFCLTPFCLEKSHHPLLGLSCRGNRSAICRLSSSPHRSSPTPSGTH